MEYKLNKIDTELRQKINEEAKEGKIHSKTALNINISKDRQNKNKYFENKNKKKKEFIEVEAIKVESFETEATKEETNERGIFIDIRK